MRAFFTPVLIKKLLGVVYYFKCSVTCFHLIPDTNRVTDDRATEYGMLYSNLISDDNVNEEASNVKLPELNDARSWTTFKDNFIMLLSLTKGSRGIPVDYIIDDTTRPYLRANATKGERDIIDISDNTIFKTDTVHFGLSFKHDNQIVWNKLKTTLLDKPGYNHISSFNNSKNGQNAWNALRTYYEGEHYAKNLREIAFNKLHTTFYRGETNRFSFEKYVNIHKTAHKMLLDANFGNGNGLDNETKIQYFRAGIKSEAGIEVALSTSRSNNQYNNFDALISFLSAEVDHHKMRKAQLRSAQNRNVSAAERDLKPKPKPGEYKNKSRVPVPSKMVEGKRVEGRYYSKPEFSKFSPKQRREIIQLKRQHWKDTHNGNDSNASKRNISGMSRSDLHDDMITLGEAIVAGVSRANQDNNNTTNDATNANNNNDTDSVATGNRSTADAGSIGDHFRSRRNQRRRNE